MSNKEKRKQELKERLEELERKQFCLQMKDRLDSNDYNLIDKYDEEIKEIEKELKTL